VITGLIRGVWSGGSEWQSGIDASCNSWQESYCLNIFIPLRKELLSSLFAISQLGSWLFVRN